MREMNGLQEKTKSTLKFFDDCLCKNSEINVRMLIVQEFGKFGNAFGISVGFEAESLGFEKGLEFFVVGDDTIVNDGEFPVRVRSVIIAVSWLPSGCSYFRPYR